ncbi:hypothetical protein Naga_100102g1 [Nannochloropsis gaditana]|uniref:Uncharacterized protein n=1 Tax=Nannochloropsis gaditana TaxID=72520 RepID=W7TR63_9STRA|nr:hypothetical protein Naga_100102g1 [Nannochloropsis gaditana]
MPVRSNESLSYLLDVSVSCVLCPLTPIPATMSFAFGQLGRSAHGLAPISHIPSLLTPASNIASDSNGGGRINVRQRELKEQQRHKTWQGRYPISWGDTCPRRSILTGTTRSGGRSSTRSSKASPSWSPSTWNGKKTTTRRRSSGSSWTTPGSPGSPSASTSSSSSATPPWPSASASPTYPHARKWHLGTCFWRRSAG